MDADAADFLGGPEELAALVEVPVQTVYGWNSARTGPRYYKIGRHVRYRRVDVERWLEQQAVEAT
ncbi:MAG: helix-turn-helix domain-containing protein [Actinomycetota bacterium]|nr:helix-turn-helix domain-containing protein [Actinomycetota bacterium]